jgi:hypothetical protein
VLAALVRDNIEALIDQEPWDKQQKKIDDGRKHLKRVSARWQKIETMINAGDI